MTLGSRMKNKDLMIIEDKNYIVSKKYDNNITKLIEDNPNGVTDKVICRVLQISPEELEKTYNHAILSMRETLIGKE